MISWPLKDLLFKVILLILLIFLDILIELLLNLVKVYSSNGPPIIYNFEHEIFFAMSHLI